MKIKDYNDAMEFFRTNDYQAADGAWSEFYQSEVLEPRIMDQASLADDLEPGALRDEMLKGFDPSQETHEEYLQRINLERPFNMAEGGRIGFWKGGKIKTVHLINETGNPNHSGIYKTTNTNTGHVSYRGGYTRDGRKTTKSSSTIKGARELLDEALKIPKGKSIIELQKERGAGNLLNNKKFKRNLEEALKEVSELEKKGYGNIDKIVKKYEKRFYKKVGSRNIDGSIVRKGTDNEFTKALRSQIRAYAKELDIYGIENPNMEKALNAYKKIKKPVRGSQFTKGTLEKIATKYNVDKKAFSKYITNLGQRNPIPLADPDEYTKRIRDAEKKAIKKFSDSYYERKLQAPRSTGEYFADAADKDIVRLQKSHLGDKLTQAVKTSNIGYAAQEINQEVLKDVDIEIREINKKLAKLYKNKPKGYLEAMDKLNTRGMDLSAATKGYKKFTGLDPYTGKEFTINFSSAAQELDPGNLLGDIKLADVGKKNKAIVQELKETAIKNMTKTKKQVVGDIKEIKKNLIKLGCGMYAGGRVGFKVGSGKCINRAAAKLKSGNLSAAEKRIINDVAEGLKKGGVPKKFWTTALKGEGYFALADFANNLSKGQSLDKSFSNAVHTASFGALDIGGNERDLMKYAAERSLNTREIKDWMDYAKTYGKYAQAHEDIDYAQETLTSDEIVGPDDELLQTSVIEQSPKRIEKLEDELGEKYTSKGEEIERGYKDMNEAIRGVVAKEWNKTAGTPLDRGLRKMLGMKGDEGLVWGPVGTLFREGMEDLGFGEHKSLKGFKPQTVLNYHPVYGYKEGIKSLIREGDSPMEDMLYFMEKYFPDSGLVEEALRTKPEDLKEIEKSEDTGFGRKKRKVKVDMGTYND